MWIFQEWAKKRNTQSVRSCAKRRRKNSSETTCVVGRWVPKVKEKTRAPSFSFILVYCYNLVVVIWFSRGRLTYYSRELVPSGGFVEARVCYYYDPPECKQEWLCPSSSRCRVHCVLFLFISLCCSLASFIHSFFYISFFLYDLTLGIYQLLQRWRI